MKLIIPRAKDHDERYTSKFSPCAVCGLTSALDFKLNDHVLVDLESDEAIVWRLHNVDRRSDIYWNWKF